jgi:hypothetical protein
MMNRHGCRGSGRGVLLKELNYLIPRSKVLPLIKDVFPFIELEDILQCKECVGFIHRVDRTPKLEELFL